eukprot:TRINITY_DN6006_c0_g1_i2.p1 TRINITY_DN6006_c0_g1~~TRINITY_DN6006_c0_g1_i2.p1  ORF type:complete len:339 (-),score=43.86 TRINITY_DN6006_c0_g1_i2:65-1081(-)
MMFGQAATVRSPRESCRLCEVAALSALALLARQSHVPAAVPPSWSPSSLRPLRAPGSTPMRPGCRVCRINLSAMSAVWPETMKGGIHLSRTALLALFILVDTGQALVMDFAEKRSWKTNRPGRQYARQTALVVESALSILTGLAITASLGGPAAVWSCFDPELFLRFLPVAVCFATGLSLKMMSVNYFQAGTIKIVGQLRLPMVAVASTLLLARRYSIVQWQTIGLITTSCVSFVLLKGQGRQREGKTWKWKGLSQLFGWVVLNVIGGIFAEMTYKSGNAPYYIQKVAQDFGHLLTSVAMLFLVVPRFNPREDRRNNSALTLVALLVIQSSLLFNFVS